VILVSYNTRDRLARCLRSLVDQPRSLSLEIVVVDNASTDGSADLVARRFPRVTLVRNDRNVGYAAANNQALAISRGRRLLLLNPDTVVPHGVPSALLRDIEECGEGVGIVGCRLLRLDGTLDLACRRSFPTPLTALWRFLRLARVFPRSRSFGRYNLTYLDPRGTYEVDSVVGAFMLVKREVYERIGGLDESFFMYGEDLDWCFRARSSGFVVRYVGSVTVVHEKGASSRLAALRMNYHFHRAMVLFHRKHLGPRYAGVLNALVYAGIAARFLALTPVAAGVAACRAMGLRRARRRPPREARCAGGVASPASTTL